MTVTVTPSLGYQNSAHLSKTPIPLIIFGIPTANRNRAVRYDVEKLIYV
jgi:hypothetical protein